MKYFEAVGFKHYLANKYSLMMCQWWSSWNTHCL